MAFVYIVTREGVYRHEIMGVFDSEKSADDHAVASLEREHDDYHDMGVYRFKMNDEIVLTPDTKNDDNDAQLLSVYSKKMTGKPIKKYGNGRWLWQRKYGRWERINE